MKSPIPFITYRGNITPLIEKLPPLGSKVVIKIKVKPGKYKLKQGRLGLVDSPSGPILYITGGDLLCKWASQPSYVSEYNQALWEKYY